MLVMSPLPWNVARHTHKFLHVINSLHQFVVSHWLSNQQEHLFFRETSQLPVEKQAFDGYKNVNLTIQIHRPVFFF